MKTSILHKTATIKCPHCNSEYLPGEIFLPGSIIGQPNEVIRDSLGKIIYEDYSDTNKEPDTIEHFTCEYCNKPFIIEAVVAYRTKEESPEADFSTNYVSLLE